jgi:acyl-CoA thioester hydrolase
MYTPVETYRGVVYPWAIDHVGHMNVQFYTARFDEASWQFLARLGLSVASMEGQDRAAVAVDQHTQYKREVKAGSLLHITTELIELGHTSIRFVHRMYDSESNELVAVSELVGVHFDTRARSAAQLPDTVRARAESLRLTALSDARASLTLVSSGGRSA